MTPFWARVLTAWLLWSCAQRCLVSVQGASTLRVAPEANLRGPRMVAGNAARRTGMERAGLHLNRQHPNHRLPGPRISIASDRCLRLRASGSISDGPQQFPQQLSSSSTSSMMRALPVLGDHEEWLRPETATQASEFLYQLARWRQSPSTNTARSPALDASFRQLVGTHRLRLLPRLEWMNTFDMDPADMFWLLRAEQIPVPLTVSMRAEIQIQRQLETLTKDFAEQVLQLPKESNGRPIAADQVWDESLEEEEEAEELGEDAVVREQRQAYMKEYQASMRYKEWELGQVLAEQRAYRERNCDSLLRSATTNLEGMHDAARFPQILQTLQNLQECDAMYADWSYDAKRGRHMEFWQLFYTAERYFEQERVSDKERLVLLARLSYSVYMLPVAPMAARARPVWPRDILLLLQEYIERAKQESSASIQSPEFLWLQFIYGTQMQLYSQWMNRPKVLGGSSTSSGFGLPRRYPFASFERALHRKRPNVRHLVLLYQDLVDRISRMVPHWQHKKQRVPFPLGKRHFLRLMQLLRRDAQQEERRLEEESLVRRRIAQDAVRFGVFQSEQELLRLVNKSFKQSQP